MDILSTIRNCIYTLGTIEVKGRDNLDSLLGTIMSLEKVEAVLAEIKNQAEEINAKTDNGEREDG